MQPTLSALRVLVIDDDENDRNLTTIHLGEAWPFEHEMSIDTAANGVEALELIRGIRFALIVLDWRMSGVGGREILQAIRKNGVTSPVVVLSGLPREAIPEDLDAWGAAYLNKDHLTAHTLRLAIARSLTLLGFAIPARQQAA